MSGAIKPVRRKRSPRFVEIAEEAGVSPSTVDRVLNERGSVSPATRARVVAAAKRLHVPRLLPETRHGLMHLDIVLPRTDTAFFRHLNGALQRSLQMLDKRIVVHRNMFPEDDEDLIAKTILHPPYHRHGLIVTAHDTKRIRDALLLVIARGEPVVTMVTDICDIPRLHFAGIDNYQAGRTAGYFVGRFAKHPGRVMLISNSLDYRAHVDRMNGCRDAIAESFPSLSCDNDSIEAHDDPDRCYQAVARVLKRDKNVAGIYNSGAGSPGIAAALRKSGAAGSIVWVGHEMSDEHRLYIEQHIMDLAIDQDPDGQAISALQHLLHACGVVEEAPSARPNEFRLYCAENVRRSAYLP
jgi:LacI family transcriptional regulator